MESKQTIAVESLRLLHYVFRIIYLPYIFFSIDIKKFVFNLPYILSSIDIKKFVSYQITVVIKEGD